MVAIPPAGRQEAHATDHRRAWLLSELGGKIGEFERMSNRHKKMHRRFRYALFACTALAATLAGFAGFIDEYAKPANFLILLVSAIAGYLGSLEGLRKPGELWLHERALLHALKDLKRQIEFDTDDGTPRDGIAFYFGQFQDILSGSLERWGKFHPSGGGFRADARPGEGESRSLSGPDAGPGN